MDSYPMFLNCPAYMDKDGGARCGLPAEVHYRYTMNSTDGPLESAKISCPRGHHFNAPIECLTVPEQPTATAVSASPPRPAGQSTTARPTGGRTTITPPVWANFPLALLFLLAWAGIQLRMTSPPHTPTCRQGGTRHRRQAGNRLPPHLEQHRRTGEEPPAGPAGDKTIRALASQQPGISR